MSEYNLAPEQQNPVQETERKPVSIKLSPIVASQAFSSTDLYYVDGRFGQNRYAYSRWGDAPVRMLQIVLQDGLEQSGLFRAILPSSSMVRADFRLEATLFDFTHHIRADGSSEGVVRMRFYLLDNRYGKLLGSQQFVSRIPADSNDARGGVIAINTAVAEILQGLIFWLAQVDFVIQ